MVSKRRRLLVYSFTKFIRMFREHGLRLYVRSFIAAVLMKRHCRSFSGNPIRVEAPDCRAAAAA